MSFPLPACLIYANNAFCGSQNSEIGRISFLPLSALSQQTRIFLTPPRSLTVILSGVKGLRDGFKIIPFKHHRRPVVASCKLL